MLESFLNLQFSIQGYPKADFIFAAVAKIQRKYSTHCSGRMKNLLSLKLTASGWPLTIHSAGTVSQSRCQDLRCWTHSLNNSGHVLLLVKESYLCD